MMVTVKSSDVDICTDYNNVKVVCPWTKNNRWQCVKRGNIWVMMIGLWIGH